METALFHPTQTADRAMKKLDDAVAGGTLTSRERELIIEFVNERQAMSGHFTEGRYFKVTGKLRRFRENGFLQVPWSEVTMPDYLSAVGSVRRQDYSDETKRDYIILSRLFYRWLIEKGYAEGDPRQLKKIQCPPAPKPHIKQELLISEENIFAMIRAAESFRDKAMITIWYECALRANEVAGLNWEDIAYEDQSARILVRDTKENTVRTGFVIAGLEHVVAWRNAYPGVAEGSVPVFVSKLGKRMEYRNMAKLLHRWQFLAGIPKTPTHYMRKSRATNLILQKTPEYVVKSLVWNNQNTSCYEAYVHVTDHDVRDGLLVNYGLKTPTDAQSPVVPIQCPACRFVNAPDSEYCRHCGEPLTEEGRDLRNWLREQVEMAQAELLSGAGSRKITEVSDEDLLAELLRRRGRGR